MDVDDHLLPPTATAAERAIAAGTGARVRDIPAPLRALWRPQTCPQPLLPWLAWALSVDRWDDAWPEAVQRDVVARSYAVHRRKGTPGAVKRALAAGGWHAAALTEGLPPWRADGRAPGNGTVLANGLRRWAEFVVHLDLPEGQGFNAPEHADVLAHIARAKNARSHLWQLGIRVHIDARRAEPPTATPQLHERLGLYAERSGPMPVRAGYLDRYRADGRVPATGTAIAGGHWPYLGPVAAPPQDRVRWEVYTPRRAPAASTRLGPLTLAVAGGAEVRTADDESVTIYSEWETQ